MHQAVVFGVFFGFVDVFARFQAGEVERFVFWRGAEFGFAVVEGGEGGLAAGEVVGGGDGGCLYDGGEEEEEEGEEESEAFEAAGTFGRGCHDGMICSTICWYSTVEGNWENSTHRFLRTLQFVIGMRKAW